MACTKCNCITPGQKQRAAVRRSANAIGTRRIKWMQAGYRIGGFDEYSRRAKAWREAEKQGGPYPDE